AVKATAVRRTAPHWSPWTWVSKPRAQAWCAVSTANLAVVREVSDGGVRSRPEGCTNPSSCRGLIIFVQDTSEEVLSTHGRAHRRGDQLAGSLRRGQLEPPVWPFSIVVVDVDSKHGLQVPLI